MGGELVYKVRKANRSPKFTLYVVADFKETGGSDMFAPSIFEVTRDNAQNEPLMI